MGVCWIFEWCFRSLFRSTSHRNDDEPTPLPELPLIKSSSDQRAPSYSAIAKLGKNEDTRLRAATRTPVPNFRSSEIKNRDNTRRQPATRRQPDPPVDSAGEWVLRAQFRGEKSFGYYVCDSCEKSWISAHSFKKYKQGCQGCETYSYPYFMWHNYTKAVKSRDSTERDGPHDRARCEACLAGKCTSSFNSTEPVSSESPEESFFSSSFQQRQPKRSTR